jgi:hypothetical protein
LRDSHRPWLHFPFIGDSNRQALFDQPQHAPIHDTLLDQDDQLVVRNGREVAAEINLHHGGSAHIQELLRTLSQKGGSLAII